MYFSFGLLLQLCLHFYVPCNYAKDPGPLKGWMDVSTVGGGKRVNVPAGFNDILCFVSSYYGPEVPDALVDLRRGKYSSDSRPEQGGIPPK